MRGFAWEFATIVIRENLCQYLGIASRDAPAGWEIDHERIAPEERGGDEKGGSQRPVLSRRLMQTKRTFPIIPVTHVGG